MLRVLFSKSSGYLITGLAMNQNQMYPRSPQIRCVLLHFTYPQILIFIKKQFQGPQDDLFDTLDEFGTDTTTDELEEYLNTPTITVKGLEPLVWWHAIGESNPLAHMAIDFLSAPGKPFRPIIQLFSD